MNYLFGDSQAIAFGPLKLNNAPRSDAQAAGLDDDRRSGAAHPHCPCRTHANHQINRIRRMFRWAASRELLPASIHQTLCTLEGMRVGHPGARESKPIKPADEKIIAAVLEKLPDPVRVLCFAQLEILTGARGGELCIMRPADIDCSDSACRVYRPQSHKTAHRGHAREVPLGKKCQELLSPYLDRDPQAFCFSPAQWMAEVFKRRNRA